MSAVFLILLLLPAGAGVCAVARCQLAEGLAVAMLGLVAAGYLLALAGLLPAPESVSLQTLAAHFSWQAVHSADITVPEGWFS